MKDADIIFWDFDGVIKESVTVKSVAFEQLFSGYGRDLASRVRRHHEANSGISRFEKIPIYLGWAGEAATEVQVAALCERFSHLVMQAVVDSAWVPGVREYLQANYERQRFILVTATPQSEILQIVQHLSIDGWFRETHGAPTPKAAAVRDVLQRLECAPGKAILVGDSEADLLAAESNGVPFILRRTPLNRGLQARFSGRNFDELTIAATE